MESASGSKSFFSSYLLVGIGVVSFLLAGWINQRTPKPDLNLEMQERAININKELLIFLSAGNKRLITDLLWVQTLIESDLEHYSGKDLNNWMYVRFSTISVLDPYFYENYYWGGQYLSIVKDDLRGAASLMEKGLKYFPDDYRLIYNLGFTYYFELNEYAKGLAYMEKVQFHPKAPQHLPSIVLKLKAELGFDYNILLNLIHERLTSTKDSDLRNKLSLEFHSLKAERDITCLTKGEKGCSTIDAYGIPYYREKGKWHSKSPFIPYRVKKKGDQEKSPPVTTIEL